MLLEYVKGGEGDVEEMRVFMDNLVEYLLMFRLSSGVYQLCQNAYKNVLAAKGVRRYMDWCDANWQIPEFYIPAKLHYINMVHSNK